MAAEDDSALLPKSPPPRPARREAAIEAALRRFDGVEEPPAKRPPRPEKWTRKPQFGLLVTASLVGVIGIPAALIAIQNADFDAGRKAPKVGERKAEALQDRASRAEPTATPPLARAATTPAPLAP